MCDNDLYVFFIVNDTENHTDIFLKQETEDCLEKQSTVTLRYSNGLLFYIIKYELLAQSILYYIKFWLLQFCSPKKIHVIVLKSDYIDLSLQI